MAPHEQGDVRPNRDALHEELIHPNAIDNRLSKDDAAKRS
jgi:hypothetical protein